MNGNIWEAICEHLNIEPDEPFSVILGANDTASKYVQYKIVTHGKAAGLYVRANIDGSWTMSDLSVNGLFGFGTMVTQQPWKPEADEDYWYLAWRVDYDKIASFDIQHTSYATNCSPDTLRVTIGNCFKTKEHAARNKFKVFERLAGKTWEEWCKENGYLNAEASQAD